jgi:PilZ domain
MISSSNIPHGSPARGNTRRHRRYQIKADEYLQVSWLDMTGGLQVKNVRALDVSEDGISIELPSPAMPLRVQFQSDRFRITGMGAVRHCHRAGTRFVVGLQFADNLHWRAPLGEVLEPIRLCDPKP